MEEQPDQYHEPLSTEFRSIDDQLPANTHVAPTEENLPSREDMLRTRNPQEPLTDEQITQLEEIRGQHVPASQVKGINQARAAGNHIGHF